MKLAISTLICNDWSLEKTIEVCLREKIDALEIRMGIHSWSNDNLPDEFYMEMHKMLQNANLLVSDLATSVVVTDYSKKALVEIERCAQIAKILHCKGLRIMLGNFRTRWSEVIPNIDREGIIRWLADAENIMAKYNTEIWIETHNEFASGKQLRALCKDGNISHCHFIWDIMHPLEVGELPVETIQFMGKDLVHVHIKDGKPWDDIDLSSFCYTKIAEGNLPILEIVKLLNQSGYQGYYSLEWEGVWRKELQEQNFSKEEIVKDFAKHMRLLEL